MPTTSNFGWTTPADTDLVKDGAAAIRTLGNGIDTSFLDLKGGTTGQILSKASNTDLDYTWINNDTGDITEVAAGTGISGGGTSGAVTITNSMATAIDAKGDLIAGTGADAFSRLAVGTNNHVLTADSTATTGMKWAAVPASAKSFSLLGTGTLTGAGTITVSGISGIDDIFIYVNGASSASASSVISIRVNADAGSKYDTYHYYINPNTTYAATDTQGAATAGGFDSWPFAQMGNNAANVVYGTAFLRGCNSSGTKTYFWSAGGTGTSAIMRSGGGFFTGTATISSISLISGTGNFDAGTFTVYGSA